MKQKIAVILLSSILLLFGFPTHSTTNIEAMEEVSVTTTESVADIIWNTIYLVEYKENLTIEECETEITKLDNYILLIQEQNKEYTDFKEYTIVTEEIVRVNGIKDLYIQNIELLKEQAFWDACYAEYPIATEIWLYMKNELGYNDIVCAGIMGNMMAETGSQTLALDWDSNGGCGYGLIQWLGSRRILIKERYGSYPNINEQLNYMHDELYGINGVPQQVSEKQLQAIMNASSPEECAYAFACYYERCATEYRNFRRGLARQAYEYFVR